MTHLNQSTAPQAKAFLLSIVMPAFNEEATVVGVIQRILALDIPGGVDLIVVNDGSTDNTAALLDELNADGRFRVIHHAKNKGKGAAVRTGIKAAAGSHILVFDADSEYDTEDIVPLTLPLIAGRADVVYGARVRGHHTVMPTFVHAAGNFVMTAFANLLFHSAISDLHTCLKLIPLPLLRSMQLREHGFGLDTEITAELLRKGFRPYELAVSYVGRSKEEGKKIKYTDALECFWILAKVRLRGVTSPGQRDRSLAPRTEVRDRPVTVQPLATTTSAQTSRTLNSRTAPKPPATKSPAAKTPATKAPASKTASTKTASTKTASTKTPATKPNLEEKK